MLNARTRFELLALTSVNGPFTMAGDLCAQRADTDILIRCGHFVTQDALLTSSATRCSEWCLYLYEQRK
jgi:hypothetical protein